MKVRGFIHRFTILPACVISGILISAEGRGAEGAEKGLPSYYISGIRIDGKIPEWPSRAFYDNQDAKVVYASGNDKNYVYFCLQYLAQPGQMSLIHDGLTLWVDPQGKKKENHMVKLNFKPLMPEEKKNDRPQGAGLGDMPGQINTFGKGQRPPNLNPRQGTGKFQCFIENSGFNGKYNGKQLLGPGNNGFDAALSYDSTCSLTLEVQIPLEAFAPETPNPKNICLGFQINKPGEGPGEMPGGMQRGGPGGGGMQGGPGGMGSGAMGGPGGGGMGGGMPGGGGGFGGGPGGGGMQGGPGGGGMQGGGPPAGNPSSGQSKTIRIWHKFNLSAGQ